MSDIIGNGKRSYGTSLKTTVSDTRPNPCMSYKIDIDKLKDGEFVAITEPKEYIPIVDQWAPSLQQVTENVDSINSRKERMRELRNMANKPTREQLVEDMKELTLKELADRYKCSTSLVSKLIREYKLQRRNLAGELVDSIVPQGGPDEIITNPTTDQLEQVFTDQHTSGLTMDSIHEKSDVTSKSVPAIKVENMWDDPMDDWIELRSKILIIKQSYLDQANRQFREHMAALISEFGFIGQIND